MAAVYWLPCYWLEGEVEPAVATEAEVQKGEEAAGCSGEEGEAASCPLEVAANLQENQKSNIFSSEVLMPQFILLGPQQFVLLHIWMIFYKVASLCSMSAFSQGLGPVEKHNQLRQDLLRFSSCPEQVWR